MYLAIFSKKLNLNYWEREGYSKTVWKNGVAFPVTDGTKETRASDIFVSGGDVYISGQEYIPSAAVGTYIAKYWKNGQSFGGSAGVIEGL